MKLVRTPSLFHSRNSLLNPLSLMKSSRLFRNFVFLFSLLGLGSVVWGERYETLTVKTNDTGPMSQTDAISYLRSSNCISPETLQIAEGEICYIFSSNSVTRPNTTSPQYSNNPHISVGSVIVDMETLDSNITIGSEPSDFGQNYNTTINVNNGSTSGIIGPCSIKIIIQPYSGREFSWSTNADRWSNGNNGNWDFQGSEAFVTFRIVGTEQAPSKKFATVIPENASTNIRVVLEQSTDLINWTTASPGVFPPSTAKRFFRVRSEEE